MSGANGHSALTTEKYARGWYLISWSKDLEPGGVMPLRYFGKDYVLFRSEDGKPVLLSAHCPHLGAHLGYGGRVEGDTIVCPFHAWRFGSHGRCTEVPYAKRIPPRAAVDAFPVQEHSGMILAYFDDEGSEPEYEVPEIKELSDPAWTAMEFAQIEIATHPREVIENIGDYAHFLPVHNTLMDDFKVIIDGPRATQHSVGRGHNLKNEPIDVVSIATYHGPAVQFTYLQWAYDMVLINAHIPIEENRLLLRFGVTLKAGVGVTLPPQVLEAHISAARDGYFEDVAIWENKCWRDKPIFADGDGPIGEVRKWYSGFFTVPSTAAAE
jgi:3-ketosteroid 9alpha-monooxygenase subunit A